MDITVHNHLLVHPQKRFDSKFQNIYLLFGSAVADSQI